MSPREIKREQYEFPLAHHMGIRPWEIDLMTVEQFDRACSSIDLFLDAQRKAAEEVNTR